MKGTACPCPGAIYMHMTFLLRYLLQTASPIEVKFYVEPPLERTQKLYKWFRSHDLVGRHALTILKPGMVHWDLKVYNVYMNADLGMTLTFLV